MELFLFLQIFMSQSSIEQIKDLWSKGRKKDAITRALFRIPNITFPFSTIDSKTGKKLYLEWAYNQMLREARQNYVHKDDSFEEPRIFWWRQLWHVIGGIIAAGILSLALTAFFWVGWWLYTGLLFLSIPGLKWLVTALLIYKKLIPWISVITIGCLIGYREFTRDISINPWKNYIDLGAWILGALIWVLLI